ncbi:hypothetical protein CA54_16640 [Symmachiella macrocystis]|uniref:Uncharacterized protein n=1 Tax=Symmachiella macrocystis TaxID=2527985 RepID=A0A5C6BLB8_9PLAN|nr:hypothetical protein [Symmachiella macrocystis]TWU12838.1 hypothetical protein CA54_16640 [Symmachiella macrocystis]
MNVRQNYLTITARTTLILAAAAIFAVGIYTGRNWRSIDQLVHLRNDDQQAGYEFSERLLAKIKATQEQRRQKNELLEKNYSKVPLSRDGRTTVADFPPCFACLKTRD